MNEKKLSRGRKLVAMSLQNEMSPQIERRIGYSSNSLSSTNKETTSTFDMSTSELVNIEDLQIDLPPVSDSFLAIYQETHRLLLGTDLFQDNYDFSLGYCNEPNKVRSPGVQDSMDSFSFVENSDDESNFSGQARAKRTKYSCDSETTNITVNKPSITIPESPEHSVHDCNLENSLETIEQLPIICTQDHETSRLDDHFQESLNSADTPPNKRKTNKTKSEKLINNREKHPMGDDCGYKCRRECNKFSIEERTEIWNNYWGLLHNDQIKWASRYIQLKSIQSRKNENAENCKKQESREYFLPRFNGLSEKVCKKFFLNTLGYKNDSIVTTISKKLKTNPTHIVTDNRGIHANAKKIDTSQIKDFVNMYNPCTAHYRRHNSPHMQYLSQDITLEKLFQDFKDAHPTFVCCKEVFRKTLREMKVSLRRPQNDKCSDCHTFEVNITGALKEGSTVPSLKLLCKEKVHKIKAEKATQAYKEDSLKDDPDTKIYSMDLQKTVLLPMIPEVKDCFFTNRLVCLNLTFCGIKKGSREGSKCMVWHEATGGRNGKDMVDAIYKFLISDRDTKKIIFWADNCSAQNKNWILFTSLVTIVNVHNIDSITIKYLTKGHTHMSADGVHGNIEQYFRKIKNIYDFQDYKQCIEKSRIKNNVIEIKVEDKFAWEKKRKTTSEQLKHFFLKNVVEVKFVKNQTTLLYKKSFDEQSYTELDFVQKKFKFDRLPRKLNKVRGVRASKKSEILSKLVPLMPVNRQKFWLEMPQSDHVSDLIREEAMMEDQ